jgi:hypothetical protein
VKTDAGLLLFSLLFGRRENFLDLLQTRRIEGSGDDTLLPIGADHDGRQHRDGVSMLQGRHDVFTDLLFGVPDRRDELRDLLTIKRAGLYLTARSNN